MPAIDNNTDLCFQPIRNYGRIKNLTGQRFGKLFALGVLGSKRSKVWWLTICDCGRLAITQTAYLILGHTRSCGCNGPKGRGTHWQSKTIAYRRWKGMRQRTGAHKGKNIAWYEHVTSCDGWSNFETFLADMGQPPSPRHQIDRISYVGGYWCGHCVECVALHHPLNCRWVTSSVQNRNRSNNRIIEYQGERLCAIEWAERFNIPYNKFHRYLQRDGSIERIRIRFNV